MVSKFVALVVQVFFVGRFLLPSAHAWSQKNSDGSLYGDMHGGQRDGEDQNNILANERLLANNSQNVKIANQNDLIVTVKDLQHAIDVKSSPLKKILTNLHQNGAPEIIIIFLYKNERKESVRRYFRVFFHSDQSVSVVRASSISCPFAKIKTFGDGLAKGYKPGQKGYLFFSSKLSLPKTRYWGGRGDRKESDRLMLAFGKLTKPSDIVKKEWNKHMERRIRKNNDKMYLPAGNLELGAKLECDFLGIIQTGRVRTNAPSTVSMTMIGKGPQMYITAVPDAGAVFYVLPDEHFDKSFDIWFRGAFGKGPSASVPRKMLRIVLGGIHGDDKVMKKSVKSVMFYGESSLIKHKNPFAGAPEQWSTTKIQLFLIIWGMSLIPEQERVYFKFLFVEEDLMDRLNHQKYVSNPMSGVVELDTEMAIEYFVPKMSGLQRLVPTCTYYPEYKQFVWPDALQYFQQEAKTREAQSDYNKTLSAEKRDIVHRSNAEIEAEIERQRLSGIFGTNISTSIINSD